MLQRTVVTMISHSIPVCISLVHVVNIRTVVVLIQNAYYVKTNMFVFKNGFQGLPDTPMSFHLDILLTITININSTGISFSIVVCVCLVSVGFKNAVVTAVTNIIPVCVILPRVVYSWAVVLIL